MVFSIFVFSHLLMLGLPEQTPVNHLRQKLRECILRLFLHIRRCTFRESCMKNWPILLYMCGGYIIIL